MNLLIVDHSKLFRERLVSLISDIPGINLMCTTSVTQRASEIVRSLCPDVVIMEIASLYGPGIYTLMEVKKTRPSPTVIVLASDLNQELTALCEANGADYYLNKFSDIGRIETILKELLDRETNDEAQTTPRPAYSLHDFPS